MAEAYVNLFTILQQVRVPISDKHLSPNFSEGDYTGGSIPLAASVYSRVLDWREYKGMG